MAQPGLIAAYAQYFGARFTAMMLGLFPVNANLKTARDIGSLLYRLDRKHRRRALENLRASFPDLPDKELDSIAERSMQHFIELIMDVLFTTRMINVESWHRHVRMVNMAQPLRVLLRGQGAIVLTGHYGNWEILGYTLATLGFETYSIARPIDNPLIDAWLLDVREKRGQVILSKRGVTTTALDVLNKKGVLGFIADQNAGPKGMFVPFFGRLASTYKSIGLLAIQNNLPLIIGYARRRGDRFEFDIGVQDIIYPEDWANEADELRYVTTRYTKAIEDFVRTDPTQYLWIHRRWKTRPKNEAPGSVPGVG
jgi:KDO2-lipid IV(A) lauroyltransferase